jgi:protein-S-isoprenylcysteine O-methyltransferase Ste14
MKRVIVAAYGTAGYLLFLFTFLYMIAFVGNLPAPKTIDSGTAGPGLPAVIADLGLIALFGVQHSLMARARAKRWLTRFIPPATERSTYVVLASLILLLLAWQWRPLPGAVWEVKGGLAELISLALFWLGWLIVLVSSFLINHFELFGLQQVYFNLVGKRPAPPRFQTPWLYKLARHPMMLGLLIAFWAAPRLSLGHLLFAAGMTAYILVGIYFEERDLVRYLGDEYAAYQRQTPMLLPLTRRGQAAAPIPQEKSASAHHV